MVENERAEQAPLLAAIAPRLGRAHVVGITGVPGAGKSTLVAALVDAFRDRALSVGVIAVDPSSPITGGAVLGDRIRMTRHAGDREVFVRSLASRGHLGGLCRTASRVIDVMDAAGKDIVLVETVGAGQSEIEVAELADSRIVISAPGLGDDVQTIKAGILEIADIMVVNKADSPLARASRRRLEAMLGGAFGKPVPVLETEALTGRGVPELAEAILARREAGVARPDPAGRVRRLLASLAAERLKTRIQDGTGPALEALCDRLARGDTSFEAAADAAIALFGGRDADR
ncbi:putative GTPase ArgK [Oceanibacterium hippocampi]|uniref:Putative GTPase ArgK n=1 Tax=Oceanibacterium hippocampi TaxID=745714 RepID=A0A1Y5RUN8_9PROT|nr:putative GTPase ArgK [Oceanibacterium hippocampi]